MILSNAKDINQSENIKQRKNIKLSEDHMSSHVKPDNCCIP